MEPERGSDVGCELRLSGGCRSITPDVSAGWVIVDAACIVSMTCTAADMVIEFSRDLVVKKLHQCFPDSNAAAEVLGVLDCYGTHAWHADRERVQLAILMQSEGSVDCVRRLAALAEIDFRDVLVGAECPEQYAAPSGTGAQEMADMCRRDRERYEAWLGVRNASTRPG